MGARRTVGFLSVVGLVALAAGLVATPVEAARVQCGGEGEPPCYRVWNFLKNGEFTLEDLGSICPSGGSFFPFVLGGSCWSCPANYVNVPPLDITDKSACVSVQAGTAEATYHGRSNGFDCPSGQFYVWVGECWSCPTGYGTAGGVAGCVRLAADATRATHHGSAVIACRPGYADIRGTCRKIGDCGGDGQRPCLIGERVPSCNEGFREDFRKNECVALRPGELPFLSGLASLGGYWGDAVQQECKAFLRSWSNPVTTDFGAGARCNADIGIGFTCAWIRDLTLGNYTGKLETLHEFAYGASGAIGEAWRGECAHLTEHLDSAIKHGAAKGFDCPSGQFWDPNGSCWSCPEGMTRTLLPVDGPRACTDRFAGALYQLTCAIGKAVDKTGGEATQCTVQAIENGIIFDKPVDVSNADQAVCEVMGEFAFEMVTYVGDLAKIAGGDFSAIVSALGSIVGGTLALKSAEELDQCRARAGSGTAIR